MKKKTKKHALAGSRTRIYCLEGNNANRYTTNAWLADEVAFVSFVCMTIANH